LDTIGQTATLASIAPYGLRIARRRLCGAIQAVELDQCEPVLDNPGFINKSGENHDAIGGKG
jgi:hypothetical protein